MMSKMNRRDFIKKLGVAGLFIAFNKVTSGYQNIGGPFLSKAVAVKYKDPINGANFGMMIDVGACIGCRICQHACRLENNIPSEHTEEKDA